MTNAMAALVCAVLYQTSVRARNSTQARQIADVDVKRAFDNVDGPRNKSSALDSPDRVNPPPARTQRAKPSAGCCELQVDRVYTMKRDRSPSARGGGARRLCLRAIDRSLGGLKIKARFARKSVRAGVGDDTRNIEAILAAIRALDQGYSNQADLIFFFSSKRRLLLAAQALHRGEQRAHRPVRSVGRRLRRAHLRRDRNQLVQASFHRTGRSHDLEDAAPLGHASGGSRDPTDLRARASKRPGRAFEHRDARRR